MKNIFLCCLICIVGISVSSCSSELIAGEQFSRVEDYAKYGVLHNEYMKYGEKNFVREISDLPYLKAMDSISKHCIEYSKMRGDGLFLDSNVEVVNKDKEQIRILLENIPSITQTINSGKKRVLSANLQRMPVECAEAIIELSNYSKIDETKQLLEYAKKNNYVSDELYKQISNLITTTERSFDCNISNAELAQNVKRSIANANSTAQIQDKKFIETIGSVLSVVDYSEEYWKEYFVEVVLDADEGYSREEAEKLVNESFFIAPWVAADVWGAVDGTLTAIITGYALDGKFPDAIHLGGNMAINAVCASLGGSTLLYSLIKKSATKGSSALLKILKNTKK